MIVVFKVGTSEGEVGSAVRFLASLGASSFELNSENQPTIEVTNCGPNDPHSLAKRLRGLANVSQVLVDDNPHPRISANTGFEVGGTHFGGPGVVLMAGPCSVETPDQVLETAGFLASLGVKWLRGGAFKPSTSPYGFRGIGAAGLAILKEAKRKYGVNVVTEVTDPRAVGMVAEVADMLQIGARNMQNFDLLMEVGRSGTPVLLKRGMGSRVEEWLLAAEHVAAAGGARIALCERGIRTFESSTRATLDLAAVEIAKQRCGLPVIVDPSHAAGRRDLVPGLSLAAVAAGADGLLIEIHPQPSAALKDGSQSLVLEEFAELVGRIGAVSRAVGRELAERTTHTPTSPV